MLSATCKLKLSEHLIRDWNVIFSGKFWKKLIF